jgi:hypothetical protein
MPLLPWKGGSPVQVVAVIFWSISAGILSDKKSISSIDFASVIFIPFYDVNLYMGLSVIRYPLSNLFYSLSPGACGLALATWPVWWPGALPQFRLLQLTLRTVCGGPSFAMYNVSFLMRSSGDLHLRLINMKGKNAFIKHNIIMGFYLTMSIENA